MNKIPHLTASGSGSSPIRLETTLTAFFALFLFASTFSIALAQTSLALSLLTFCGLVVMTRRLPENLGPRPLYIAIGVYIGWQVISSLAGTSPLSSLATLREEWLFLILPLGILLGRHQTTRSRLLSALAVGVLLIGIYGIIQHFTGAHWFKSSGLHTAGGSYRLAGNFSHPLTYGYFVATSSAFFLNYLIGSFRNQSLGTRILFTTATLASLTATVLCMSRGPLLALGIGLIVTGLMHRQFIRIAATLLLAIALAWIVAPKMIAEFESRLVNDLNQESRGGRLYIWKLSGRIIKDDPITGVGPGNFSQAYSNQLQTEAPPRVPMGHAHNDFLNLAATIGIPGLLLYLSIWGIVMVQLWHRLRNTSGSRESHALATAALIASVAFCVGSMTEAAFADEELRQLITALWAFGLTDS